MPHNESEGTKTKRFRIAFSFAGEKRAFVEKVARILADRFGEDKVLYDKFHEAEFAVFDLGIRLPKLYDEQSDLIVPVICPQLRREALDGLGMGSYLWLTNESRWQSSDAQPF